MISDDGSLRQFLEASADKRGGLGRRSELSGNPGHGGGGLRLGVAEADEGEDRVLCGLGELGRALEACFHMGEIGPRKRGRLVLELEHKARGEFRADPGRARHHRLVLPSDRRAQSFRRESAENPQRDLGAYALHALQQAEPIALGVGEESEKPDRVFAHVCLDEQLRGLAGCGQRAKGPSRRGDEIAHAVDVEDDGFLVRAVDDPLEFADHATPLARAERCWAWQMATASASAASEVDAVEAGNSTLTIIATCRFSAWPTPTTVFLMRLAAYSATGRPVRANVARATPRACPSFSADCGSRLMNVSSTAASCGPSRSTNPVSKRWIAARRSASEVAASVSIEPQPMKIRREPAASITPQPVLRRPGSTPRMRIAPMVIKRLIYEIARQRILLVAILARGLDQARKLMLDRPEFSERDIECAKSDRLPDALHPLGEIGDGQRQLRRAGERALLIDEITPVYREEHVRGAGERTERASGDVSLIASGNGRLRALDAEQNLPLEAANERLAQLLRVGHRHRLQSSEYALRIAERPAKRDFADPDRRAEAMRMARLIVHADAALATLANHPFDRLDLPVEQVHFLAANREP